MHDLRLLLHVDLVLLPPQSPNKLLLLQLVLVLLLQVVLVLLPGDHCVPRLPLEDRLDIAVLLERLVLDLVLHLLPLGPNQLLLQLVLVAVLLLFLLLGFVLELELDFGEGKQIFK